MTAAWLRPRAEDDLVERARHYREHAGRAVAERFVDEAFAALRSVERMPNAGSPRAGELVGVEGLRSWRVRGFPVRWYYLVLPDRLDVVRLLADAQDLPTLLENEG